MTPLQMAAAAAQALASPGTLGVTLTVRRGGLPKTFPRGELLNSMERCGRVESTYSFDPHKVIAWLLKNGLVEIERKDNTMIFSEPLTHITAAAPSLKPSAGNTS
jgi:hypothetical protein